MNTVMRVFFLISLALSIPATPAFGWGCEGHQIVALIARAHLTPAASAAVTKLLTDFPMDPKANHPCKDLDAMVDAATWADDTRSSEKTGPWHYVDIPLSEKDGRSLAAWCPPVGPSDDGKDRPGCVTDAIEYEWSILLDTSRSGLSRAVALRYLIHFVGDMHQPLHDSDNDDQGGNCTAIQFFAEERPANLHSIWDTKLIQHELGAKKETRADYAKDLDQQFADHWPVWGTSVVDPTAWAWEGSKVARTVTYGNLKPAIAVEQPGVPADCSAEREKVSALHIAIGDAYSDAAMPAIGEQLAKAGYRLADLLNRTF
jgi:hypothetical protein